MLEFLEVEEFVGRRWHRWASRAVSYPDHADAACELETLKGTLGVMFRASGGEPGVTLGAIGARASRHRLSLRQRLGFDEELLATSRLDEEQLLLPERLAVLPTYAANRDLLLWLAMSLPRTRCRVSPQDPLLADLTFLAEARRATLDTLTAWPGFAERHAALCRGLLAARPVRKLPPGEAQVEALVRWLLGDPAPLCDAAKALRQVMEALASGVSGAPMASAAPRDYRPFLPVPLWGRVTTLGTVSAEHDDEESDEDSDEDSAAQAQEVAGAKRQAERRYQDQAERDDPLMLNASEKMLSWAEMVNVNRHVDDEKEDAARQAADQIEEIVLSRHHKRAASRLKLELDLAPGSVVGDALVGEHTYPEWDYRKGILRRDHCRVIHEAAADTERTDAAAWQPDEASRRRIQRVRRQFEALRPRREILRAQPDGDELDLDALIRTRCDLAATGDSRGRCFLDTRARSRDMAVSILVDVSLSTDAWLEQRRVLDVSREALQVLGHGLAACGDDTAIHSFTSQRRHKVWVRSLKTFDEPMGEAVTRRIGALEPGHYTRMGPAIRHLTKALAERPNRHRLLLVLTDGKPNDTDYYEGRYAIEDTRHAVREAARQGIKVFAVTIDREANRYVGRIFGRGGFAIVPRPEHLALALPAIYRQLVAD